ncbi:hypothetical protein EG329_002551 [Mollisiaceae sp. DMI_Dod_QoI]|nr:hypothetical protein EG329_002551 [Helotiales sp. DMI_Dod_QoI]
MDSPQEASMKSQDDRLEKLWKRLEKKTAALASKKTSGQSSSGQSSSPLSQLPISSSVGSSTTKTPSQEEQAKVKAESDRKAMPPPPTPTKTTRTPFTIKFSGASGSTMPKTTPPAAPKQGMAPMSGLLQIDQELKASEKKTDNSKGKATVPLPSKSGNEKAVQTEEQASNQIQAKTDNGKGKALETQPTPNSLYAALDEAISKTKFDTSRAKREDYILASADHLISITDELKKEKISYQKLSQQLADEKTSYEKKIADQKATFETELSEQDSKLKNGWYDERMQVAKQAKTARYKQEDLQALFDDVSEKKRELETKVTVQSVENGCLRNRISNLEKDNTKLAFQSRKQETTIRKLEIEKIKLEAKVAEMEAQSAGTNVPGNQGVPCDSWFWFLLMWLILCLKCVAVTTLNSVQKIDFASCFLSVVSWVSWVIGCLGSVMIVIHQFFKRLNLASRLYLLVLAIIRYIQVLTSLIQLSIQKLNISVWLFSLASSVILFLRVLTTWVIKSVRSINFRFLSR